MLDLSICLVSLNCRQVLSDCLHSIPAAASGRTFEIIIVDNASRDGTRDFIATDCPAARLIRNQRNIGFTRATNQAMRAARGRFVLWLNTDTVLYPGALDILCNVLEAQPHVAIVGPRVLNPDGTFQPQCRRGMPTIRSALAYFSGLARFRPNNRQLNGYLLGYLPTDSSAFVDAVSGCCLLARREVLESIGYPDERYFGFGEDLDWCVRARRAGWQVRYEAASVIVHIKGAGGVHTNPYHKIYGMHQGMWLFYRTHLRTLRHDLLGPIVWVAIWLFFIARILVTAVKRTMFKILALRTKKTLDSQHPVPPPIPDRPRPARVHSSSPGS
jgi:GT2 family glycosyltransferase